ncbi:hypothetical protein [Acidovorax soli]|uniref:Uncharacterized protein n=1 Tax=Acidovorax soli TaxID=592050 RepID=A0A1H4BW29_9BURK|nr:hypothetical protein [Acidovorax soli]SEA52267.1 hypothetical protein SAMN05421875_11614 [Acidovorax soli]
MKALDDNAAMRSDALDAYPPLLRSMLAGQEFMPLIRSAERPKHRSDWRAFLRDLTRLPPSSSVLSEAFHTQWHVCHHRLRELVEDDDLMLDAAWVWLPRYKGPGLDLFRGENIDRFEAGQIGSAWSDKHETAKTFASGLNAVGMGGVILRAVVPAHAIVAGPSAHSSYLGESEFTIDTRRLGPVSIIARFPPSH